MTLQVHLSGSDMRFRFRGQAVPAEILVQALDFLVKLSICHTYVKYLSGRWVPPLTGTRVWLVLSWGKFHNLRSIVSIPEQRGTQISLAYFHSYQDGYRTTHPNLVSWGGRCFQDMYAFMQMLRSKPLSPFCTWIIGSHFTALWVCHLSIVGRDWSLGKVIMAPPAAAGNTLRHPYDFMH